MSNGFDYTDQINIEKSRAYEVVKHNDLVTKTRYSLDVQEQKVLLYVVSKIKPTDEALKWYTFDIADFCKCCGIDEGNGKNYQNIKKTITNMIRAVFWIETEPGVETSCNWINKARIEKKNGKIKIRLDDDLHDYLLGLQSNFLRYQLLNVLPMKSQYSVRLYELLQAVSINKTEKKAFLLDDLRRKMMCEHYSRYTDFRKYVLEISEKEINKYTDLEISWKPIKKGKKVIAIGFTIVQKDPEAYQNARKKATDYLVFGDDQIEGQMSLWDEYEVVSAD